MSPARKAPAAKPGPIVDVDVGGGSALRLSVGPGRDGAPALVLTLGTGSGTTWRPSWLDLPLSLPADALPALRAALDELEKAR